MNSPNQITTQLDCPVGCLDVVDGSVEVGNGSCVVVSCEIIRLQP